MTTLTEELELKVQSAGSVTLNQEDLKKGVEPESGFYIQNASLIWGRKRDLVNDPPPDLVVEVDIISSSTRRLNIYRALQVLEVWRCSARSLEIKRLEGGEYVNCESSVTFPMVTAADLWQFLEKCKDTNDNAVI